MITTKYTEKKLFAGCSFYRMKQKPLVYFGLRNGFKVKMWSVLYKACSSLSKLYMWLSLALRVKYIILESRGPDPAPIYFKSCNPRTTAPLQIIYHKKKHGAVKLCSWAAWWERKLASQHLWEHKLSSIISFPSSSSKVSQAALVALACQACQVAALTWATCWWSTANLIKSQCAQLAWTNSGTDTACCTLKDRRKHTTRI